MLLNQITYPTRKSDADPISDLALLHRHGGLADNMFNSGLIFSVDLCILELK